MSVKYKVRIFQPSVPEYRVSLFESLGEEYGHRIEIFASKEGSAGVASIPLRNMKCDYAHSFIRLGPFSWQKRLSLEGMRKGDVLIVDGDIKQISSLYYSLCAKLLGIKVIWWGHHWSATSKMWKVFVRLQVVKLLADVFLCYTKSGVDFLKNHGFRNRLVYATGNTIDQRPIIAAADRWDEASLSRFRQNAGISNKTLFLVCGVLRPKMKLGLLIKALTNKKLMGQNVLVAVIGDGPEKQIYQDMAISNKVDDKFLWLGASRDQKVLAPWFLSAVAFVYPGAIGLGILHAFSYGLPVVTHGCKDHQMPEYEAMEDGKTGVVFVEDDADDLARKLEYAINNKKAFAQMGQYASRKALSEYTMNSMVSNFKAAIEAAVIK
jgi:glycosyltransferase involved in cell wall biosynthesis